LASELKQDTISRAYAYWAPFYDLVFGEVFKQARHAAIEAAEHHGGRILEVGVGTGLSLPDYKPGNQIVGVDISEPMLRKARAKVADLALHQVEGLAVMDAEHMAFPDESFDVIVAQYVITTVSNPEGTLDEFARVLKNGGEIILITRVGADSGPRHLFEKTFAPLTHQLGWRLQFPWTRYVHWAERPHGMKLVERRLMPPFGHFSLVRFVKTTDATTVPEELLEATAIN